MVQLYNGPQDLPACCRKLEASLSAKLFKALCDPNRIAIVSALAEAGEPRPVGDIAACRPTDLSVVSRHLATLREAGVVNAEKRGRSVYYGVRYDALAATLREMADALEACCPGK
jgi:ArsR family transcriptional regulator